jgi:hypothetical protein
MFNSLLMLNNKIGKLVAGAALILGAYGCGGDSKGSTGPDIIDEPSSSSKTELSSSSVGAPIVSSSSFETPTVSSSSDTQPEVSSSSSEEARGALLYNLDTIHIANNTVEEKFRNNTCQDVLKKSWAHAATNNRPYYEITSWDENNMSFGGNFINDGTLVNCYNSDLYTGKIVNVAALNVSNNFEGYPDLTDSISYNLYIERTGFEGQLTDCRIVSKSDYETLCANNTKNQLNCVDIIFDGCNGNKKDEPLTDFYATFDNHDNIGWVHYKSGVVKKRVQNSL